jgi:hypothetical protein
LEIIRMATNITVMPSRYLNRVAAGAREEDAS